MSWNEPSPFVSQSGSRTVTCTGRPRRLHALDGLIEFVAIGLTENEQVNVFDRALTLGAEVPRRHDPNTNAAVIASTFGNASARTDGTPNARVSTWASRRSRDSLCSPARAVCCRLSVTTPARRAAHGRSRGGPRRTASPDARRDRRDSTRGPDHRAAARAGRPAAETRISAGAQARALCRRIG